MRDQNYTTSFTLDQSPEDVHRSTHKITEFVPHRKVVWHTTDSHLNFIKDKAEWTGPDIVFEIARKNGRTELRFTHIGLLRANECYDSCSVAWSFYINHSLFTLITKGKGESSRKDMVSE